MIRKKFFLLFVLLRFVPSSSAQTTEFSYQGKLTNAGAPATGTFDFNFKLFPGSSEGTQIGSAIARDDVQVVNGIFTVTLDFGSAPFVSGGANYLEIWVRPGSETGGYTQLLPRAQITSSPYAVQTISAQVANALSSACVGCVSNNQIASIQGSKVTGSIAGNQISGTIPVASVPAGS